MSISIAPQTNHIFNAMATLASSMDASNLKFRLATENMANANSTASTPGGTPYQRKLGVFTQKNDRNTGADIIALQEVANDPSEFREMYEPGHPAADENGMVLYPNVDTTMEAVDAQDANMSLRMASALYKLGTEMQRRINGLIDPAKG